MVNNLQPVLKIALGFHLCGVARIWHVVARIWMWHGFPTSQPSKLLVAGPIPVSRSKSCGGWFETGKLHLCVPLVPAKSQVRVVICQGQNLSPESLKALMDMALKAFDWEGE